MKKTTHRQSASFQIFWKCGKMTKHSQIPGEHSMTSLNEPVLFVFCFALVNAYPNNLLLTVVRKQRVGTWRKSIEFNFTFFHTR